MFQLKPLGDRGIRVQLGDAISKETNKKIRSLSFFLEKEKISGVVEWIPTYTSVSIYYDPFDILYEKLEERLLQLQSRMSHIELPPAQVMEIPVYYGGDVGPDLGYVASYNGLNEEDVIRIHTENSYLIYMMGFSPGFPYLGGMSEKIATPRLKEPRLKTPAGSVGIAGSQTGVYSMETPGGWQIIGRTPVKLYNPTREKPILLKAGNYIRFVPITKDEYQKIEQQVKLGRNEIKTVPYQGE